MSVRLDHGEDQLAEVHEINVTPFIDVMLVLLIIFMVAAPLATVDIQVNLPAIQVQLPALVTCLGTLNLGTISLPAHVNASGSLNVATLQLTINATVSIPFSILGVSFPINIPIGPIVVKL